MDIKELAERYKRELPKTDNELEFIRAVCIKLGQEHSFDVRYYMGNRETRNKIKEIAQFDSKQIRQNAGQKTIVCYTLSYKEKALLREFGYDVDVFKDGVGVHVYPVVHLHDGRRIKTDIVEDLPKIQTKQKTEFFGTFSGTDEYLLDTIPQEELKESDLKIGYIQDDYNDNIINDIKSKIMDKDLDTRLDMLLSNPELIKIAEYAGYVECEEYYRSLLRQVSRDNESIYMLDCKKGEQNSVDYTNCIYASNGDGRIKKIYIFSKKDNRYIKVDKNTMNKLVDEGLNVGIGKRRTGKNLLLRNLKREKDKETAVETNNDEIEL